MKKRKGLFLLDALLGLLILSSLAAALYPLLGQAAYLIDRSAKRGRIIGEGLYAMDFMTEHMRNHLKPVAVSSWKGDQYTYYDYNEKQVASPYTLYVDKEKLYLELYNGLVQPITGESGGKVEAFAFQRVPETAIFTRENDGCIHIGFQIFHQMSGEKWEAYTSIIPYADYYKKGTSYD